MSEAWEEAVAAARSALRDPDGPRSSWLLSAVEALCAEGELPYRPELGRDIPELVALLDGLGLPETADTLLEHVAACLRRQPGLLVTLAPALDRLAVALAAHGRYEAAAQVTAASVESATERAAAPANFARLALRRGDTVGAAELAVEARRLAARSPGEREALDVAVLETAVFAEVARREGLHAEADELVDELAGYVRRLARLAGDDDPATQSALAALAWAEFASAEAAGDRARMERAVDVLAVVAQRMSATLGGRHPRALSVLRSLATAEYAAARTSGDRRRLAGAETLVAAVVRRTEGRQAGFGRRGPDGTALAESLISHLEPLLAGEQSRPAVPLDARRQLHALQAQLSRARACVDDRPGTAYALALDALHQLDELARALDQAEERP
ncbi:hypothetical protein [Streptomyces sp. NPDC020983]|uniref:hypothetical protein n=1 Tax=Streptomyces sp. NPDC020983 TaxID=3365106 RepID=UPI0037920CDC